jgi:hypothetical protein
MRDFDSEKPDLEFKIGGETFVAQRVRPEVLAELADQENTGDTKDALKIVDAQILSFLGDNGDRERWQALRAREEDPITIGQMNALLQWMLEASSDLPTVQPSLSAAGPGTAGG